MAKRSKSKSADPRAKALGQVWQSALAMLFLSIPICVILRSPLVPIAVVVGAALVTFYIWNSAAPERGENEDETEALRAKVKELEERLANVEVINRFEDRLAEKQLRLAEELRSADRGAAVARTSEKI